MDFLLYSTLIIAGYLKIVDTLKKEFRFDFETTFRISFLSVAAGNMAFIVLNNLLPTSFFTAYILGCMTFSVFRFASPKLVTEGDTEQPNYNLIVSQMKRTRSGQCIICFADDDELRVRLPCHSTHIYHATCISDWFLRSKSTSCPLCRSVV